MLGEITRIARQIERQGRQGQCPGIAQLRHSGVLQDEFGIVRIAGLRVIAVDPERMPEGTWILLFERFEPAQRVPHVENEGQHGWVPTRLIIGQRDRQACIHVATGVGEWQAGLRIASAHRS